MAETETQEIVVDFGKICRLCLTEDGVLISLYSTESLFENRFKSIPEKILDLMAIKVTKDDGFPSWICHNCLSQVDRCCDFFDMCRSSQFTLNESYFKALTDAGVNVSTLKTYVRCRSNDMACDDLEKEKKEKVNVVLESKDYFSKMEVIKEEMESDSEETSDQIKAKEDDEGNNEYLCNDCAKIFTKRDEFLIHRISVHHDDLVTETTNLDQMGNKLAGTWNCDACGAKFRSRGAVTTHIRYKHLNEEKDLSTSFSKLIFCKYCGSSLARKYVSKHLEIDHRLTKNLDVEQTDLDSFDCKICFRPFMRQSSLRNHIEKFHGDSLEMIAEAENCDIVWNCTECDSLFSEEVFLMQHYGNKHSKYPLEVDSLRVLKCKNLRCNCGVIMSDSFDAFIHEIFCHKEESDVQKQSECPACHRTFPCLDALKRHLISFHWFIAANYDNECTFCCKEYDSTEALRIHLHDDHDIRFRGTSNEEDPPGCEEESKISENEDAETGVACDDVCDTKENLSGMQETLGLASGYACDACGDCFRSREDFEKHVTDCQTPHSCDLCGKLYKSENHLKRHIIEYHNTMSPIKCPLCPKVFPRKMNLHNHYKRRHLKQSKKFVCSYCGLSLKGKVALRSHEDRLHRNVRNYKCSECPEAFTTRSILRKHAQRHLAERPMLQCQYCERKFSTISGIERHVKTHEGVKDFVCDLPMCGKSFYTKSELKRHIKFHTKDFRHVCPVCNHKFMSPGELKKHSTKHTGERPFKCHLCSCAYARRDDKVKHLKRIHNLKVKRIYGKPLRKYSDESNDPVDTIVVDDECSAGATGNEDLVYADLSIMQ